MQILKLGGSVITNKERFFSVNKENIKRLAGEIAESDSGPLVVVHGGGSYGHPVAKKYMISEGLKNTNQLIGFSKTHQAMTRLNQIVVDTLLEKNIPAFGLSASSMLVTEKKRLIEFDHSIIRQLLDIGLIPVLYGDAVLDSEQGVAILSGDQLVVKLAVNLGAKRVIFGSDVDGVFNSDPKVYREAELIPKVSLSTCNAKVAETVYTDVTGGMKGKLAEAKNAVNAGSEVLFLNATIENRVKKALKGEKVMGTILTL